MLEEEFTPYGVNNLGWSAFFKIIVPDLVAGMMFWYHYRSNKITTFKYDSTKTDSRGRRQRWYTQFRTWWSDNGFSQHNWAWFLVGGAFDALWSTHFFLFFIWKLSGGWLSSWQEFYIEHIISNFNWGVYGFGLW